MDVSIKRLGCKHEVKEEAATNNLLQVDHSNLIECTPDSIFIKSEGPDTQLEYTTVKKESPDWVLDAQKMDSSKFYGLSNPQNEHDSDKESDESPQPPGAAEDFSYEEESSASDSDSCVSSIGDSDTEPNAMQNDSDTEVNETHPDDDMEEIEVQANQESGLVQISTVPEHDASLIQTGKKTRQGVEVKKPQSVLDYNVAKKGVDISDQMSYYSALKKNNKWYKKVAMELLTGVSIVNAWVLFNKYYCGSRKWSILNFRESVILSLLTNSPEEVLRPGRRSSANVASSSQSSRSSHCLAQAEGPKRKSRKRCVVCYEIISLNEGSREASKKAKKDVPLDVSATPGPAHESKASNIKSYLVKEKSYSNMQEGSPAAWDSSSCPLRFASTEEEGKIGRPLVSLASCNHVHELVLKKAFSTCLGSSSGFEIIIFSLFKGYWSYINQSVIIPPIKEDLPETGLQEGRTHSRRGTALVPPSCGGLSPSTARVLEGFPSPTKAATMSGVAPHNTSPTEGLILKRETSGLAGDWMSGLSAFER
ncbi:PiggyBac transposable element-derived protein [Trinorchestia longiramus]|nr:PiggyBac transposable element-derived protein [Trinorchestia longiramus]